MLEEQLSTEINTEHWLTFFHLQSYISSRISNNKKISSLEKLIIVGEGNIHALYLNLKCE